MTQERLDDLAILNIESPQNYGMNLKLWSQNLLRSMAIQGLMINPLNALVY